MDNNINFNDLWKKQSVSQPDIEDLFLRMKQFKKTAIKSLWITNILLIATSVFIGFIWYYCQPQFISTKIGIVVIILAMVIYLFTYNKLFAFYKVIDTNLNNQEYLQNLILIKKKQQFLQSTMLSLYYVLLSAGLCLYMYEYASRMSVLWGSFTYGLTLLWITFNWFYFRPKHIKKQQNKINTLIAKFKGIENQLKSDL